MLRKIPVIVILGSTGTGKTKLSIELAEKFGGEIISADSMQVYPKLDVVTAKATKEEQEKIKHHLLDVANVKDPFTVLNFRNMALPIVNNLLHTKRLPIIVGGTNYYIESLLWEILVSPPSQSDHNFDNLQTRSFNVHVKTQLPTNQIQDHIEKCDLNNQMSDVLHEQLMKIDPITAKKLHPNNKRKIIRALEVYHEKGIPLSKIIEEQRNKPGGNRLGGPLRYPHTIILWLHCNQDILNIRLDKRIKSMLEQGLISELRNFYEQQIRNKDVTITKGALQTIGLKEFLPYLEKYNFEDDEILENYLKKKSFKLSESIEQNEPNGLDVLRKCLEELKAITIRYSKKQIKWIKNRFLGYKDRQVPPLYKLDTSNVEFWNENVYEPAVNIIESYINNKDSKIKPVKQICHPSSELNEETLNICDICKRHFVGEFQWQIHLKSNKHKRKKESLHKNAKLLKLLPTEASSSK